MVTRIRIGRSWTQTVTHRQKAVRVSSQRRQAAEWQKWINYDSPYQQLGDKLNRERQFHYYVDSKGRVWRQELDKPGQLFGELREPDLRNDFFRRLKVNDSGLYPDYPFLVVMGPEHYFVTSKDSPIVFFDCQDDQLVFGHSLVIPFQPDKLVICSNNDDHLYHPISVPHQPTKRQTKNHEVVTIYGLLEKNLAYRFLRNCEKLSGERIEFRWNGGTFSLKNIADYRYKQSLAPPNVDNLPDPVHVQHNTKWWAEE